jgi:DNA-binding MarR family transcriptional regulator
MDDAQRMADVLRLLLRTFTIDESRFPPAEGQMRYSGADFQTLHFVGGNPGCAGLELASFLGVAPTTAQSIIDRLVKRGYIEKLRSAEDRRAVALSLTESGEALRAAIARQDRANCQQMLASLPATERGAFVAQLEQIAASLDLTIP